MAGTIDLATYSAKLVLDDKNFTAGMSNAEKTGETSAKKLTSNFAGLGSTLLKVGGVLGAGWTLNSVIDAASKSEERMAQLDAVLKSTGGTAGVTKEQVTNLADSLGSVTKFGKGAIIEGQNLLLTFTGIGKDVFPQTTETMLNMSQALGQDLKSSAIQLGKSLQDPTQGMTALRRVGVSFTADQEKQIKTFQESGDVMGAQKLILAELNKEFGGSAKAAGETFAGQLDIAKRTIAGLGTDIGKSLLPTLKLMTNWVNDNMPMIKEMAKKIADDLSKAFSSLSQAIKFVIDNSNILIPVLAGVASAVVALSVINTVKGMMDAWKASTLLQTLAQGGLNAVLMANPIGLVVLAIGALIAIGVALYLNWDKVSVFLISVWGNIKKVSSDTFSAIGTAISTTWDNIKLATENIWNGIKQFFIDVWNGIVWIFKNLTLLGIITSHWDDIKRVTENVFNGLKTFFTGIWDGIVSYLNGLGSTFLNIGSSLFDNLWTGLKNVWTNISSWIENSMNWLKDKLTFWQSSKDKMSKDNGSGGGGNVSVPQYAVGTPFVPNDQLALIHKGEAIIPAQYNPYNGGNATQPSSNSGDSLSFAGANFHFNTHDGFDVTSFVNDIKRISKTRR